MYLSTCLQLLQAIVAVLELHTSLGICICIQPALKALVLAISDLYAPRTGQ